MTKNPTLFFAAAKVGGILATDTYRADFIYENLQVQNNIIHGALTAGVRDMCFLGSSCIYRRDRMQPIKEEYLLSGPFERTNESCAIAKMDDIKLCENMNRQSGTRFVCVMPTSLYVLNDS